MILGTAAYMSPGAGAREGRRQARRHLGVRCGAVRDAHGAARVSGRRRHRHARRRSCSKEPDWSALPADDARRPSPVAARCLKKDPKQRLRDIGDARLALERARSSRRAGRPRRRPRTPATAHGARGSARCRGRRCRGCAVRCGAGCVWAPWRAETPVDRPLVRLDVDLGADVSLPVPRRRSGSSVAISPDGTRLVYASGTPRSCSRAGWINRKPPSSRARRVQPCRSSRRTGSGSDSSRARKVNKISVEGGAVVPLGDVRRLRRRELGRGRQPSSWASVRERGPAADSRRRRRRPRPSRSWATANLQSLTRSSCPAAKRSCLRPTTRDPGGQRSPSRS